MKISQTLALCFAVPIATNAMFAVAGATIPPPSPPPLCTDLTPPPGVEVNYVTYRYHSDAPPSSVGVCSGNQPNRTFNQLPDGSYEYIVTRPAQSKVWAYMMCRSSNNVVTCEASPTSKDVALGVSWHISGNLGFSAFDVPANALTISVTCLAANGTGVITLKVKSPYIEATDMIDMPVTCTGPSITSRTK